MKFRCAQPIEHGVLQGDKSVVTRYLPGQEIDLTADEAEPLLAIGHVAAIGKKAAESKDDGKGT